MCRPTRCRTCGKTTWAGCGQHVGEVKARVPAGQWCEGHAGGGADGEAASGGGRGLWRRLVGR